MGDMEESGEETGEQYEPEQMRSEEMRRGGKLMKLAARSARAYDTTDLLVLMFYF